MSMRTLEDLRMMLCEELDAIAQKGEMTAGCLDVVNKSVQAIKNIDKIMMSEGSSSDGGWEARGTYDGESMAGYSGRHYVRGHYSRDGAMRGRYSSAKSKAAEELEKAMNEAGSEREREAIKRCIMELENA